MNTAERNEEIVRRARAGESYRSIAESLGMGRRYVAGIGHASGVRRLNCKRQRTLRVPNGHGYTLLYEPTHPRADPSTGYVWEHVVIAERAIGRSLPPDAIVHHVNGDKSDNRPQNFVICPDNSYHRLIHARQRALEMCGNANWVPCVYCHAHDDPANLSHHATLRRAYHKRCAALYSTKSAKLERRARIEREKANAA